MKLETLLRRWRRGQILAVALRALGVFLGLGALVWTVIPAGPAILAVSLAVALAAGLASIWLPRPPMADRDLIAKHLDRVAPQMEDSTLLVNRQESVLSSLEILQAKRVRLTLETYSARGLWPRSQVLSSLRYLVCGTLIAVLVLVGHARWATRESGAELPWNAQPGSAESEVDPLHLVAVEVRPPAYTLQPASRQDSLNIEAVEGSRIRWSLPTEVAGAVLDFAGGEPLTLQRGEDELFVEMVAEVSDVYQLVIGGEEREIRSAYARLAVIPDELPRLRIVRPPERVTSLEDPSVFLDLVIEAEDDHGLGSVELVSTLAQGSGELVEFRQHRELIDANPKGVEATFETRLDLVDVGLEAGSELYFFAEARDNREPHPNVGRSATYIVRIPVETLASADLGEGLPIVLPPDYFRSQRQIILDTEKLIAAESDLSAVEFGQRSEGLGFDQRALRMRYGTLLGEEFDSGRPVGAGEVEGGESEDHEHSPTAGSEETSPAMGEGPLEGVPADFVHFHDSAEISTFFTSEIRTQLKQVLAQMWEAEGRLRVRQPREALPFEYRALELLKDLQQRSRIYVQKVGFETPPLEPEKIRLTGELEDIQTHTREDSQQSEDPLASAALNLLTELRLGNSSPGSIRDEAHALLRSAMAHEATRDPQFLLALEALDNWAAGQRVNRDEQGSLETALWQLVPPPEPRPGRRRISEDRLAEMYRAALAAGQRP